MKLLLAAVAFFLLAAAPAHADPITGLGLLIGGLTGALSTTQIVLGVISMGARWLVSTMMEPKGPKQRGVKTKMETGGDKPPAFIVGEYATTAALDYANVWDGGDIPQQYLVYVEVLSALPVHGISNFVYINGERCNALWGAQDADGFSYVEEYEKNDTHYVRLKFYDGTQTGADPWLLEKFGDDPDRPWKDDMHLDGCAYVIAVCSFSNKGVWAGNPEFRWVIEGAPVYDPRKDSTVGGSGPQRWGQPATYAFSKNLKVLEYNTIRGFYYKGELVWGGGAEAYRLPLEYWFAAMNVCDENVEKKNGDIINRYEGGLEIHFDDKPIEIIEEFNKACCGYTTEYGGTYKTWCGDPGLPIAVITDDDFLITAEQEANKFQALTTIKNTAYATYPEPGEQWEQKDGPQYQNAAALEEDGQELAIDIQLPVVSENNQVQRVMRATVLDSRRQVTHSGQLPPDAFIYEPNDRLLFISQTYGYHGDGKDFLVASKEDLANVNQQVVLRELNPNDTGWLKEYELDHRVGPLKVVKVPSLALDFTLTPDQIDSATGKDRPAIRCAWDWAAIDIDVNNILFEIRRAGTTKVIAEGRIRNPEDGVRTFTQDVLRFGKTYEVKLKPEPYSNRDSVWTGWKSVTLVDLDIPGAPTLTPMSDLADDGSQVYALKIDWPNVAGEVTYSVRVVVDGDERYYQTDVSRYKIPAISSKAYTVDVRAIGADGNSRGQWSPAVTQTVTKKNTNSTPPTALTVTGKFGKNIVRMTRNSAMKDFGKFKIYASATNDFTAASLIDDTPASRFEHGELGNSVSRWYWATTVDRTDNESAKFPASNTGGILGTTLPIVDDDNDPTPPGNIPSAPSLSQLTADIDKDKSIDTGLLIAWSAPVSGRAPKRYFVELFRRRNDKGTDGNNVTGYTLWQDFYTNKLSKQVKANANFFHKARITPVSANEVEGTPSAYTSVGVQPLQYLSSIPQPAAPSVDRKGNGFFVKAAKATFANYQETIYFANGVEIERRRGNTFKDDTARSIGDSVTYTVQYVDNQDRVGLVSLGTTVIYRAVEDGETDPTAPGTPIAPVLSQLTADVDGDSTIDTGLSVTMITPAGVPVKFFEVELQRSATLGGTYTAFGKRHMVKADSSGTTVWAFEGSSNKFYKARYRAIAAFGKEGAYSSLNATGVQPLQYLSSIPTPSITVIPKPKGMSVRWSKWQNSTYLESILYRDGVELWRGKGNAHFDSDELVVNSSYTYTVQHQDKQDRVGALSPPKSDTYRQALSTDIGAGAVLAGNMSISDAGLVLNGTFRNGSSSGWSLGANSSVVNPGAADPGGKWQARTGDRDGFISDPFDIEDGEVVYARGKVKNLNVGVGEYASLMLWTQDEDGGNNLWQDIAATTVTGSWVPLQGTIITNNANAKQGRIILHVNKTQGVNPTTYAYFGKVKVRRATTDSSTDQTAPATPGAGPSASQTAKDLNGDGIVDMALRLSAGSLPAGAKSIIFKVDEYLSDNTTFVDTYYEYPKKLVKRFGPVIAGHYYRVSYAGVSFNQTEGGFSSVTTVQAAGKTTGPADPTGAGAGAWALGLVVAYNQPTESDYDHTDVAVRTSTGTPLTGEIVASVGGRGIGTGKPNFYIYYPISTTATTNYVYIRHTNASNQASNWVLAGTFVNNQAIAGFIGDGQITYPKLSGAVFNNGISAMGLGDLGTYAYLKKTNAGTSTPGDTVSGSNLVYSDTSLTSGANPSGTWMCMGRCPSGQATQWLRVS